MSALDVQEGGGHYKKYKIQPIEFAMLNGLDTCQHAILKYVCRFRDKGGIEDLRKARHYLDLLEEFEYGKAEQAQAAEPFGSDYALWPFRTKDDHLKKGSPDAFAYDTGLPL